MTSCFEMPQRIINDNDAPLTSLIKPNLKKEKRSRISDLLFFLLFILLFVVLAVTLHLIPQLKTLKILGYISVTSHIQVYAYDPWTSELQPKYKLPTVGSPGPLALSPDQNILFAGIGASCLSYMVNKTNGDLKLISQTKLPDFPVYLGTNGAGRFLFVAFENLINLEVYAIGTNYSVDPNPTQIITPCNQPNFVSSISIQGIDYVYVVCTESEEIYQYVLDQKSGVLHLNSPGSLRNIKARGPMIFSSDASYAYVISYNSTVSLLHVNPNGTLDAIEQVSTLPKDYNYTVPNTPTYIQISPNGNFLYASNNSTMVTFLIDSSGRLTQKWFCSYYDSTFLVRSFSIDPSGRFLLAVGERNGTIERFRVDVAGSLSVAGPPLYVGSDSKQIFFLIS
eukprot:TRINITY_DN14880_c0_g1_i1.p1 TRINITY_DN14880_c0_g1~~TRINITY_DN14880_c0_g1_i1.p1  ORF type:complete len:395 (+),score=47.84 TRINITY_DN14880_c0_g1_i1:65-1249(+)